MGISQILATSSQIRFSLETSASQLTVVEKAPVIGGSPARTLSEIRALVKDGTVSIPRFDGKHDRLTSRFEIYDGSEKLPGICFVTDFSADASVNHEAYPQPVTIKALGGTREDVQRLQLHQTLCNLNLPAMMTTQPAPDDIAHEYDGRTYYFVRSAVESADRHMISSHEMGLLVTLILLNAPRHFGGRGDKRLESMAIHPDYDRNFPDAFISAFNLETEDGAGFFGAFIDFLAQRYTRADRKYGFVGGMVISNEINSQYVWGNAGDKTCHEYCLEYTYALRTAWLCGHKHYSNLRVYVSLDHYWDTLCHDRTQPTRYYPGRTCIEEINRNTQTDGDFDWNIAHHPYPEDLSWCNFWMDRSPNFSFSTPRITFKNMEVLEAYMAQKHMLYRGQPRRLIFSEQGFNSRGDAFKELTEEWAAAAYCLAYMKARKMKTLDLFTHHAYVDNPHEFGLNLGIRRYDPEAPGHLGECKPIYYSIEDMDTDREPARIEKSRQVVGPQLFDFLLDPPIEKTDEDVNFFQQGRKNQGSDFGT